MLAKALGIVFFCLSSSALAFYASSDVIELNEAEFKKQVLKGDEVWLVEFYAPWCGHCKNLIPDMKKVATQLKGVVKVGAVDGTAAEAVMQKYQVQGFPTIKIFGADKKSPQDYNGERTAAAMVSESMKAVTRMIKDRAKNPSGSSSSGSKSSSNSKPSGGGKKSGGSDVVTLTEVNFNALVMESQEEWLVEFYAPWCGHCKNLAPEWEQAATRLKGTGVNLGAVDATAETALAQKYGVKGYPTIKVFPAGKKKKAKDYNGPREAGGIVDYALQLLEESGIPPATPQLTSQSVLEESCGGQGRICVIMFVPHILDSQAKGREGYLATLGEVAKSFRGKPLSFMWSEGGAQPDLESVLEVNFNYPTLTVLSTEKKAYAVQRLSWSDKNIKAFLNGVMAGSERTLPLPGAVPAVTKVGAWDGKDAVAAKEEFSLEDLMGDE